MLLYQKKISSEQLVWKSLPAYSLDRFRTFDLHVLDEVSAILGLLQSDKEHFRARDVLPWIGKVVEQCLASPHHSLELKQ